MLAARRTSKVYQISFYRVDAASIRTAFNMRMKKKMLNKYVCTTRRRDCDCVQDNKSGKSPRIISRPIRRAFTYSFYTYITAFASPSTSDRPLLPGYACLVVPVGPRWFFDYFLAPLFPPERLFFFTFYNNTHTGGAACEKTYNI